MAGGQVSLTFRERLEQYLARAVAELPPSLQIRLSGKPPVRVDGETLAPEVQLALSLLTRRGQGQSEPPAEPVDMVQDRLFRRRVAAIYGGKPAEVGAVHDLEIDAGVRLPARHYAPAEPGGPHPLLVFFHGGGFAHGDLETHDTICRLLCRHSGAHVLAIDYRLAPEHPFPAAVEDARGALRWAYANASQLGADPRRVGVAGESAGGNLAAVVAQLAARDGGPPPALQLLIYPVTDFTVRRRSRQLFGEGFLLTTTGMDQVEVHYLGENPDLGSDPRVSPILAEDLSGLAPALVVTAAFDPLRDEGEEYARALQAAGTPAAIRRFPGFIHGFMGASGVSPDSRAGLIEVAGAVRGMFALLGSPEPGGEGAATRAAVGAE